MAVTLKSRLSCRHLKLTMNHRNAAIDLLSAAGSQILAVAFLHAYHKVLVLRLTFVGQKVQLAALQLELLVSNWYVTAAIPVVTLCAGWVLMRRNRQVWLQALCQLGWLIALALICFAILASEIAYIPV